MEVKKDEGMNGIDLFKSKIKNIQDRGDYYKVGTNDNDLTIAYHANECVNTRFSWKIGELKLSSLHLVIVVNHRAFECVFDKSEFGDIVSNNNPSKENDTIVEKSINLKTSRYRLPGSKVLINSDIFFSELSKCDSLVFHAWMRDLYSKRDPYSSLADVRYSNFIHVFLND